MKQYKNGNYAEALMKFECAKSLFHSPVGADEVTFMIGNQKLTSFGLYCKFVH